MASSMTVSSFRLCILLVILESVFSACDDCVSSRASYYGSPDSLGNDRGACGYGSFGRNLNGGDVACAAQLYRDGLGCGACYQVICTNQDLCTEGGVKIVITDMGQGDRTDFILSRHGYAKLGLSANASDQLVAMGVVDIQYKRVSCQYPGQNLMFKIDESTNFPYYLAFIFWYQAGQKDILAVDVCETATLQCKLRVTNHGAVWDVVSPPAGDLSIRFLVSDGDQQQWITAANAIPANWTAGAVYDSGIQLDS